MSRPTATGPEREHLADVMLALMDRASWVDTLLRENGTAGVVIDGGADVSPEAADVVRRLRVAAQQEWA